MSGLAAVKLYTPAGTSTAEPIRHTTPAIVQYSTNLSALNFREADKISTIHVKHGISIVCSVKVT